MRVLALLALARDYLRWPLLAWTMQNDQILRAPIDAYSLHDRPYIELRFAIVILEPRRRRRMYLYAIFYRRVQAITLVGLFWYSGRAYMLYKQIEPSGPR